jgi:hypothetical protein
MLMALAYVSNAGNRDAGTALMTLAEQCSAKGVLLENKQHRLTSHNKKSNIGSSNTRK